MKVLIIGANGYIGSRLTEYLKSKYEVHGVDFCAQPQIIDLDYICDYGTLCDEQITMYSHIILLAGHSAVSNFNDKLLPGFQNNVVNFIRLVEKMNAEQVLLYASTAAVYGNNPRLVWEDEELPDPVGYYDFTKYNLEKVANLFPNKKMIGMRFGTVGGWSRNFRIENLMNALSLNAIEKNEIHVSNISNWRAVLGLNDLCRCIELMLERTPKNRFYNLVSYNDTIGNVATRISNLSGCKIVVNDALRTNYSFNCSNRSFAKEYGFEFVDTTDSIFFDILENKDIIQIKKPRGEQSY